MQRDVAQMHVAVGDQRTVPIEQAQAACTLRIEPAITLQLRREPPPIGAIAAIKRGVQCGQRYKAASTEHGRAVETGRLQEHARTGFDDFAARGRQTMSVQDFTSVVLAEQQVCPASSIGDIDAIAELYDDRSMTVVALQCDCELRLCTAHGGTDALAAQDGIGELWVSHAALIDADALGRRENRPQRTLQRSFAEHKIAGLVIAVAQQT